MFFNGLGTAVPARRYTQRECWDLLMETEVGAKEYERLTPRSRALVRKVLLGENGIEARHLCLATLEEAFAASPDLLQARFARHAPALAAAAADEALRHAGSARDEIDALLISTCTGYLCPGLTSYVAERLGLRSDIEALDLVGQGCGAAVPNLRTAEALLSSGRCRRVLSICVEVCSAAFYLDNDPGVLISACLFGDGAAAAVLSNNPPGSGRRVEWKGSRSMLQPANRDYLRFEHRDGMLRNILSIQVPALAGKATETLLAEMFERWRVEREQVAAWILHAGGKEILVSLRQRLGLTERDLTWSAEVLRRYGNLSSPSVLFVLKDALEGGAPPGQWWLCTFGAGFSCHGAWLDVQ